MKDSRIERFRKLIFDKDIVGMKKFIGKVLTPENIGSSSSKIFYEDGKTFLHLITEIVITRTWKNKFYPTTLENCAKLDEVNAFRMSVVEELYSRYGTVDIANKPGITPLYRAVELDDVHMVECFLKNGASPFVPLYGSGQTPLHIAASKESTEVLALLLTKCPTGSAAVKDISFGNTPLHIATKFGRVEASRILVEHSPASLSIKNQNEYDPLVYALFHSKENVVKYLLKKYNPVVDDSTMLGKAVFGIKEQLQKESLEDGTIFKGLSDSSPLLQEEPQLKQPAPAESPSLQEYSLDLSSPPPVINDIPTYEQETFVVDEMKTVELENSKKDNEHKVLHLSAITHAKGYARLIAKKAKDGAFEKRKSIASASKSLSNAIDSATSKAGSAVNSATSKFVHGIADCAASVATPAAEKF